MDTYEEAEVERVRIAGLLEDNADYSYRTSTLPLCDEFGNIIGYAVGVGWLTEVLGDDGDFHEYGYALMVDHVGAPVKAITDSLHHNYKATMAELGYV
jgi:hypothetical protein